MSEDGIITGGPKGNPKGKPKVNTDTVKSKKSKDPFIDQIAALVIPKSITGFAARYIVLKLLKRLVEWGFLSANKAAMLKQNQSPTRRTFKADVITAADLSRIADLFFMKDAHPDKKVLDSYINAAEDVGISEQRALSYLRELLDASTLKKLKLAESYEDNDIDVVYVDVLTGNLHAEEGDNRMPVHIDTRGGQPDDLFGSIEPDLRERILLAAAGGTEPKSGLYPRGITEKGKEIWDRVMKDYGDTFNERYASNKWEHPKNEVLWAYAILTYQNVANKQGVTPFTGGTQPDTRPPDEVAPAPPPAPAPPAPAAPAPAPLPTPEPVPEPAPVPLPVVEEEEIDLDEMDARLAKQVSTTQTMLNVLRKEAVTALRMVGISAIPRKSRSVFYTQGKKFWSKVPGAGQVFWFGISTDIPVKDVDRMLADWGDSVDYLEGKGWSLFDEAEHDLWILWDNTRDRHGDVILAVVDNGNRVELREQFYFAPEDAESLTDATETAEVGKRMISIGNYYRENNELPPSGDFEALEVVKTQPKAPTPDGRKLT